jgi:hypothetical protein
MQALAQLLKAIKPIYVVLGDNTFAISQPFVNGKEQKWFIAPVKTCARNSGPWQRLQSSDV